MNRFDVIVVGAGPAGITTAYLLAKKGVDVLLIERGERAGVKNMFGGVVVGDWFQNIAENLWDEEIIERPISRKMLSFFHEDLRVSLDFENRSAERPYGFTTYRPKFDDWYADQARKIGVKLFTELTVRDLLVDGDRVVGVKTDKEEGEIYANLVVLADGVNSIIHRKNGYESGRNGIDFSLGAKEVVKVDQDVFRRLGLYSEKEGLSHEFIGLNASIIGGGFLYTNIDTISVGVVVQLRSLLENHNNIYEVLNRFKNIPYIRSLISDGKSMEYSAHLIPGANEKKPILYSNGLIVVGDASGLLLNTGLHFEGVNYAVASGVAAAETIRECVQRQDYSKRITCRYLHYLNKHHVLRDMRKYRKAMKLVKSSTFHGSFPKKVCNALDRTFRYSMDKPKNKLLADYLRDMDWQSKGASIKGLYNVIRSYVC